MKQFISVLFLILFGLSSASAKRIESVSPDGKLRLQLTCGDSLQYRVLYEKNVIVDFSGIGLYIEGYETMLSDANIRQISTTSQNNAISPLYGKNKSISDHYNETTVNFGNGISLHMRAYNDGVAYRFCADIDNEIIVTGEKAEFNIGEAPGVLFPETDTWNAWELQYIDYSTASAIPDGKRAITPVLLSRPDGIKAVIAEADVMDYPGMYLTKRGDRLSGTFAAYPDSVAMGSWGNFVSVVKSRKGYIAKTSGKRDFPWRVIIPVQDDRSLLENEIIYKLSSPQDDMDFSWVKPGKAAWEWWHDAMLPGADIPSGMKNRNTALYKHYIDFAAENNLEYLMIDAGWSNIFDLSKINPAVDIHELIRYGKKKNVDIFLWCVAHTLISDLDRYMAMFEEWGVAGLKVDFFDRDDQLAMKWYEQIAETAARHRLMLDYHGCSKPTGLQRKYPNIINYEAVRGAECSKWDLTANPEHHLTFPFTRMLCGSVDYTPGAMRNRSRQMFKPVDPGLPSAQGTRCHELAMFVVFDQYLAMLCDSPEEYRKYPDILGFLSVVPVSFDQTVVLSAEVGNTAVVAKRKGSDWYVGGMTDWTARLAEVDFSFLPEGQEFNVEIFRDANSSNLYADRYVYEQKTVASGSKMEIRMAAGGGFAMHIYPVK